MKHLFLSLCAISMFYACSKPKKTNDGKNYQTVYYKFSEDETKKLLNYAENQLLVFKNEQGVEKTFLVTKINQTFKEPYGYGMGFYLIRFYFDQREIFVTSLNDGLHFDISFKKWPYDLKQAESDSYTLFPSNVMGTIHCFPKWNGMNNDSSYQQYIPINFANSKIEMNVNGIVYSNVHVIKSMNQSVLGTKNNVNVIYYDERAGIIGFDDLDGNHWRLVD